MSSVQTTTCWAQRVILPSEGLEIWKPGKQEDGRVSPSLAQALPVTEAALGGGFNREGARAPRRGRFHHEEHEGGRFGFLPAGSEFGSRPERRPSENGVASLLASRNGSRAVSRVTGSCR